MTYAVRKFVARICILMMTFGGFVVPQAQAAMIGTDRAIAADPAAASEDRRNLADFVARDDVREKFLEMGVEPAEVDQRLANLTDAEVTELSKHIDEAPAGGIVGAIIIIFLIWFLFFHIGHGHGHGHR